MPTRNFIRGITEEAKKWRQEQTGEAQGQLIHEANRRRHHRLQIGKD